MQYLSVSIASKIGGGLIADCKRRLKTKTNLKLKIFLEQLQKEHKKIIARDPYELSKTLTHTSYMETIKEIQAYFKGDKSCKNLKVTLKCIIGRVRPLRTFPL